MGYQMLFLDVRQLVCCNTQTGLLLLPTSLQHLNIAHDSCMSVFFSPSQKSLYLRKDCYVKLMLNFWPPGSKIQKEWVISTTDYSLSCYRRTDSHQSHPLSLVLKPAWKQWKRCAVTVSILMEIYKLYILSLGCVNTFMSSVVGPPLQLCK